MNRTHPRMPPVMTSGLPKTTEAGTLVSPSAPILLFAVVTAAVVAAEARAEMAFRGVNCS